METPETSSRECHIKQYVKEIRSGNRPESQSMVVPAEWAKKLEIALIKSREEVKRLELRNARNIQLCSEST